MGRLRVHTLLLCSSDDLAIIFTGAPAPATTETTSTAVEESEGGTSGATTPAEQTGTTTPLESAISPLRETPGEPDEPLPAPDPLTLQHPLFDIEQLGVDNRLIVNRKRQLKMHRVWMQGKFIKLPNRTLGT